MTLTPRLCFSCVDSHFNCRCCPHACFVCAAVCTGPPSETSGEVYGFSFVYSGNFLIEAELTETGRLRLNMGINPMGLQWHLLPGTRTVGCRSVCYCRTHHSRSVPVSNGSTDSCSFIFVPATRRRRVQHPGGRAHALQRGPGRAQPLHPPPVPGSPAAAQLVGRRAAHPAQLLGGQVLPRQPQQHRRDGAAG
jgi:hypothetical protein